MPARWYPAGSPRVRRLPLLGDGVTATPTSLRHPARRPSGHEQDHRGVQPEGWGRKDHHHDQPRRVACDGRPARPRRRHGPAGEPHQRARPESRRRAHGLRGTAWTRRVTGTPDACRPAPPRSRRPSPGRRGSRVGAPGGTRAPPAASARRACATGTTSSSSTRRRRSGC